jgi:hypothetical protein
MENMFQQLSNNAFTLSIDDDDISSSSDLDPQRMKILYSAKHAFTYGAMLAGGSNINAANERLYHNLYSDILQHEAHRFQKVYCKLQESKYAKSGPLAFWARWPPFVDNKACGTSVRRF